MPIHTDIISTVGKTPLVKLNRIIRGAPATIALKGEFFNPLGIGCSTGERYLSTVLAEEARKQVSA